MRTICAALSALVFFLLLQGLDREVTIVPPTTHETTVGPTRSEPMPFPTSPPPGHGYQLQRGEQR